MTGDKPELFTREQLKELGLEYLIPRRHGNTKPKPKPKPKPSNTETESSDSE